MRRPPLHRPLVVGAVEAAAFSFALGCLVQFWALFVQRGCAALGMPDRGLSMTMYTLVLLAVMETAASYLGAAVVERLERRKAFVTAMGLCTHGAWFVCGLVLLAAPETWFLAIAFLLLVWRGFFDGMLIGPWLDLAARVVPSADRPRFFSTRLFVSSIGAAAGAAAARAVFAGVADERRQFALLFLMGGAAASAGDLVRLAYRETGSAVSEARRRHTLARDLREAAALLLSNRDFRRLCWVSAAGALVSTLYPHIVPLFATNAVMVSAADYAGLTVVLQVCTLASCYFLPRLVRWLGWRGAYSAFLAQMAAASAAVGVAATAASGATAATGLLTASFLLMGTSSPWGAAEANVLYELTPDAKRPSALAVMRTFSNGVGILCALAIAGWHLGEPSSGIGFAPMFLAIAAALACASLLLRYGIAGSGRDG